MSKIKNGGLDRYGAEPLEQQQFGTSGTEGVNAWLNSDKQRSSLTKSEEFNRELFVSSLNTEQTEEISMEHSELLRNKYV